MEERLKKLRSLLHEKEAYLILNPADIRYFSGMKSSNIALLVTEKRQLVFSDARYLHLIQSQQLFEPVVLQKSLIAGVCEIAGQMEFQKLIIEPGDILYSDYLMLQELTDKEIVQGNRLTKNLRMIKTKKELEAVQRAQEIAEKAYDEVLNEVRPGNTSKRIAAKLDYLMNLYGSEEPAFETIVVSGEDTINCHGVPNDRPIETGDFVLFDFGATWNGYRSDMTRTVGIGSLTETKIHLYQTVLQAHLLALEAVRPGMEVNNLDKIARDYIEKAGYREFLHSLGHGVGLDIHEQPSISLRNTDILREGMVITIEPGIYVKGVGGVRIEDTVAVTDKGCRSFASTKKELIMI